MPKLGMAGSSVLLLPAVEALKIAIENKFDAFEIFGEFPQCVFDELKPDDRAAMADLVADSGIDLAVHAPFTSLNPAALNPGARAESLRQIMQAIDLCSEIGGSAVIVHNGEHVLSPNFRAKAPYAHNVGWENNIKSLQIAANFAREQQVKLCLENIGFEPDHMDRSVVDMI